MKSDLEIARKSKLLPIKTIAEKLGIKAQELTLYGEDKAKLSPKLWERIKNKPDGKLILVTATSPTPLGEGKTTTSIGLAMALNRLGKKTVLAIREPSLGPCFGIKGGACGGGFSQVAPMEDINLHFTGDLHAITTANNLLATLIDNHLFFGNKLNIDPRQILWKRAVDLNDRALRQVIIGLGGKLQGMPREDGFNITVASEIMAILCLSENLADLKKRLKKICIAYTYNNEPVYAESLKAEGPLAVLLKDALKPNLVQTLENTPAIIHGGPFANIAHGCNSVLATRYGLKLGDYLVTEAGFGADLGAEKFLNIKCRLAKLKPSLVVIVTTVRSLKYNGGVLLEDVGKEDQAGLEKGIANLKQHLENLQSFGLPVVVTVNRFQNDRPQEINLIARTCQKLTAEFAESRVWELGGAGGLDLAQKALQSIKNNPDPRLNFSYSLKMSIPQKIEAIGQKIYHAQKVVLEEKAQKQLAKIEAQGLGELPVCIAKNQYSFSGNPTLLGAPTDFDLTIKELRISSGAGFIVALAGEIMTMPGLPAIPAAEKIDLDKNGEITGLF
jgi:formate--tetrahydrofolate ligase